MFLMIDGFTFTECEGSRGLDRRNTTRPEADRRKEENK